MPRGWSYGHKRDSGYRSRKEEELAKWLKENGVEFEYEQLKLNYDKVVRKGVCKACGSSQVVKVSTYTPDFVLTGNGVIIEYKGRLTAQDRTKLLSVMRSNPGIKLKILFGSDNKLDKRSKKRYSQWASEHGFDYGIGSPPRRWFRGLDKDAT